MASSGKRSGKLHEFVAHAGNVNCAALGHDSGRVFASGGEDRKVNLWAVGKPSCILSLSGHTSPVETVRFRPDEKAVIAGSLSGAVKIWDLEAVKILRTLTGHRAAIRCVDYHPFNDFLITGSMDTTIKVWDMRRKSCLYTYVGHTNSVNCLRFSPDGQWMASGGEDGVIKLWDMATGKPLSVFRQHTGPVNTILFHPNDLLLASGSSDRTVKFWDLEEMQMVGSTDGDSTPVRSLLFHPKENCIYSAGADFLRVYGWEPSRCYDSVSVGWSRPADIATVDTQLVGLSFSQSTLSTYVVEIQNVQPLGGPPYQHATSIPAQPTSSVHRRRSFLADRPHTQCSSMKISEDEVSQGFIPDEEPEDNASSAEIPDMTEYTQVFRPRHELSRGPVSNGNITSAADDRKAMPSNANKLGHVRHKPSQGGNQATRPDEPPSDFQPATATRPPATVQTLTHSGLPPDARSKRPPTSCTKQTRSSVEPALKDNPRIKPKRPSADDTGVEMRSRIHRQTSEDRGPVKDRVGLRPTVDDAGDLNQKQENIKEITQQLASLKISESYTGNLNRVAAVPRRQSPDQISSGMKSASNNLIDEYLPKPSASSHNLSESAAIESISSGHDALISVLSTRHRNLLVIKTMWISGNIKMAVDAAVGMNDQAVLHDVVNMMIQKATTWSLDHCTSLLPVLGSLISSKRDSYVDTGMTAVKLILRSFAPIIKANITAPPSVGVDISREERANKCLFCYQELMKIRSELDLKCNLSSGQKSLNYKEIQLLMNQLD